MSIARFDLLIAFKLTFHVFLNRSFLYSQRIVTVNYVPDLAAVYDTKAFVVDDEENSDDDDETLDVVVPEVVRNFVRFWHQQHTQGRTYQVNAIYERHFNTVADRYFKASAWPTAEEIAPLVDNGE